MAENCFKTFHSKVEQSNESSVIYCTLECCGLLASAALTISNAQSRINTADDAVMCLAVLDLFYLIQPARLQVPQLLYKFS